jgi:hypothetical protein
MTLRDINCARIVRDGGIDAAAALNEALKKAIVGLPALEQQTLKHTFGHVIGEVVEKLINPAVRAFPELHPDEGTWVAVAKERAAARANAV